MKKIFILGMFLTAVLGMAGCGQEYAAEKEMWHAQKAVKEILANPEATPPGQFEVTANRFRAIIKKYPDWPDKIKAQWAIVELYIARKHYGQAEKELEKIIADYSDNKEVCAQAKAIIGSLYEMQHNWEGASIIYARLIKDYPQTSQGLAMPFYLASRYQKLGDFPKAAEAFTEAIKRYETVSKNGLTDKIKMTAKGLTVKARFALAVLYEKEERWPEALALLKKIMNEYPYSQEGLRIPLYIANHYQLKDDKVQAESAFNEAISYYQKIYGENKENPLGLIAINLESTGYFNQKNWEKAIETQEKIIKEYPKSPGIPLALLNMGIVYERELKDKVKAIATYQRLIEKFPRSRLAQVAKKRVDELKVSP